MCHAVRPEKEIITCDDKPICRDGDCKEKFYAKNKPRPRFTPATDEQF